MDAAVALQRKKTIKFLCIVDFSLSKQGIFFITLRQQKLVETTSFNELFLCLGQKWSLFGHFDPKMTPKRENDCARTAEIFNRPGAFCG